MDVSSLVTSLVTSAVIFAVLVVVYEWLSRRPGNYVVYYPNRFRTGLGPPMDVLAQGPFAWIRMAWKASEDEVIACAGLDARVYIIYLQTMFCILLLTALYSLPVLLVVSVTDNNNAADVGSNAFDNLAMGNVHRRSPRIWAFVIGAYWLSLWTYAVMWRSYKHVKGLRFRALSTPVGRPEHFTVLVRDIPNPETHGKASYVQEIDSVFRELHPETYLRNLVVVDIGKVSSVWDEIQKYKRKLARAEAEIENHVDGRRPSVRSGPWGLFGNKVDAIGFYTRKIRELLPQWEMEKERALKERQQRAAFAVFNSRAGACVAAQTLHLPGGAEWNVSLAPDPRGVVWENLPVRRLPDRVLRRVIVYCIVFLTICFYMIPITAISAIITLPQLEQTMPFLRPVVRLPIVKTILPAYLPQLALIVFLALLPWGLQLLSWLEGLASKSEIDRAAAGKYFYFSVFNVFLGVSLASSLFIVLKKIINNPPSTINLLSKSLPPQAAFFITFVSLKFLVGYGLNLLRLVDLAKYHVKRKWMCKTQEEIREAWKPDALPYATVVPSDMVVATIALCYSIMAPMILPFTIAYYGCAWLVMQNQVLNVYFPSYESNGRMWPHMQARILAGLFLSQLTMLGLFGAKAGSNFVMTLVMIPLPIATLVYAYISKQVHYPPFGNVPLAAACAPLSSVPTVATIMAAYTPSCLAGSEDFQDVDKFEDTISTFSSRTNSSTASPA